MVVVVTTALPRGSGMSRISWTLPYTEYVQSNLGLVEISNQVDQF